MVSEFNSSETTVDKKNKIRRKPLHILLVYLYITVITYIVRYASSNQRNMVLATLLAIVFYACIALGYNSTSRDPNTPFKEISTDFIEKLLIIFSIVTIIVSLVNGLSSYSSVDQLLYYLRNPAYAYNYVKQANRYGLQGNALVSVSSSLFGIIITTLNFTKYYVLALLVLYWTKIKGSTKVLGLLAIIFYVLQCLLIGAMINVGVFVFSFIPLYLYRPFIFEYTKSRRSKRAKISMFLFIALAVIMLFYFMGARYANENDSFIIKIGYGIDGLTDYISHGYVGFSNCLDLEWKPTWGLVSTRGLSSTFLKRYYDNAWINSYLYRVEQVYGWKSLQVWSTIFPWIASDFSYFSIPFIMILFGRCYRRVWEDALYTGNPFAFVVVGQLTIAGFMFPANNQLFHTYGNAIGFIIIYVLYYASRRRLRIVWKRRR